MRARIELDYRAAPRRSSWPGALLIALSLALGGALWLGYRDAQRELLALQTVSSLAIQERRPASPQRIDEQQKSAHFAMRQLALPWVALIESLEQAATADVAVLVLQPDGQQGALRLTAEARHRDAMFEYLRRLGNAPALAEVHLVSHQLQLEDPQRPIQFSVQAVFRSWR